MKTTYRNLKSLKTEVAQSEELQKQISEQPKEFVDKLNFEPIDIPWVFATVVGVVGIALVISIVYVGIIADGSYEEVKVVKDKVVEKTSYTKEIPQILGYIASSAVAAIIGLLAPSPIRNENS